MTPTPTPSASLSPPAPRLVAWHSCPGGFECAHLEVPIDYDEPGGAAIELALIRHPASKPSASLGSIVINPGGPGGSGVEWVRGAWEWLGPEISDRFDIVGFDPRGIGQSEAVHCLDTRPELAQAFPTNPSEEAEFIQSAKAVAAACQANSGKLLPHVGTENVARDLDQIRVALGEEKLTYVGFSYGTLIGALYADMFPARVRAMVLDGPVDPSLDLGEFINTQSAAAQQELDEFLDMCADEAACAFHSQTGTRDAFEALMTRFEDGPIDGVTAPVAWAAIYQELVADDDGGLATILQLAQRSITWPMADAGSWARDARALDGYDAVNCVDYPAPRSVEGFAALAEDSARDAPDVGPPNTYTYFNCAYWPVESQRGPRRIVATGAPPILVVAATGDPSTPYEWGQSPAEQLSSGILLTREGDGHTSQHVSECVRNITRAYLLTLATPADGTTCT